MSRVMGYKIPRPSAGEFCLVGPVVVVEVDTLAGDEVMARFADDGDDVGCDRH